MMRIYHANESVSVRDAMRDVDKIVSNLQEENERLLAANRHSEDMYRQIDDERKRLQAEVERLRTERDQALASQEAAIKSWTTCSNVRSQLKTELTNLQIEVNNLRGLKPEIPPMPGEDWPKELPRYMLRWNGDNQPTSIPYKDGYWTPWYLANRLYEKLERERKAVKTACENWGEMKQERDQLKARVIELEEHVRNGD